MMQTTANSSIPKIFMLLIFAALMLMLSCCTPQKRLSRLLQKHPYLIEQRDTLTRSDTIIRPVFRHDTLFLPVQGQRDTFIISTPRGVTNVYLNEDKSEVRVNQKLNADTAVSTDRVIRELVDTSEEKVERWLWKAVLIVAFFMVLYFVGVAFVRRFGGVRHRQ